MAIPDFDEPIDVDAIKASLVQLHLKVDSIIAEIGPGIPSPGERGKRETLRERLHTVEQDSHTFQILGESLMQGLTEVGVIAKDLKRERDEARIAEAALETARLAQRQANDKAWSMRSKIGLFTFAFIGAVGTVVSLLVLIFDKAGAS